MPRGIPKHKAGSITKMDGMRRALAELGNDVSNRDIQDFLERSFGLEMDLSMISNYKSSLKKSGRSAMIAMPAAPTLVFTEATPTDGITLDDVRAVKEVIDKIGADKVRQLTEVLGS